MPQAGIDGSARSAIARAELGMQSGAHLRIGWRCAGQDRTQ
jgi:hypothetical protein